MPKLSDFAAHVLYLLSGWGGVAAGPMFGGYGLYRDGTMFGLVWRDSLYLRTDDRNRAQFDAENAPPFIYGRGGVGPKTVTMSAYREAPPALFDEPEMMILWARQALTAAVAARSRKPRKKHKKLPR